MNGSWLLDRLADLDRRGLRRRLIHVTPLGNGKVLADGRTLLDFSSNDYLGLSHHPAMKEAARQATERYGVGSRASRLMSGNVELYRELERAAAHLKSTDASVVFGSGYVCNMAVIASIVGRGDCIVMDRLCHASIVDGALLSGARIKRFHHNDMEHLRSLLSKDRHRYGRVLVAAESVYSMDGDLCPLDDLMQVAREHDCILLMDEAHALGVFGTRGEGLVAKDRKDKPDLMIGTFGKALGSYGAFVCCSEAMKDYLVNRARGLIYSTALPPSVLAANIQALRLIADMRDERLALQEKASRLRAFIEERLRLKTAGRSQIVPLVTGDVESAVRLDEHLYRHGILARAVRPPTVPEGTSRIRFSLSAGHDDRALHMLMDALTTFFE